MTSLAGEWLTAAANTNMFTYEIAPVFILMEHECLKKMREIIGKLRKNINILKLFMMDFCLLVGG